MFNTKKKIVFDTQDVFKVDPENSDNPGVSAYAPYRAEHMNAVLIEKLLCKLLDLDWSEYDKSFLKL